VTTIAMGSVKDVIVAMLPLWSAIVAPFSRVLYVVPYTSSLRRLKTTALTLLKGAVRSSRHHAPTSVCVAEKVHALPSAPSDAT